MFIHRGKKRMAPTCEHSSLVQKNGEDVLFKKKKELTLGYTQYSFDDGIWALFYSLLKNQMFMYSI